MRPVKVPGEVVERMVAGACRDIRKIEFHDIVIRNVSAIDRMLRI